MSDDCWNRGLIFDGWSFINAPITLLLQQSPLHFNNHHSCNHHSKKLILMRLPWGAGAEISNVEHRSKLKWLNDHRMCRAHGGTSASPGYVKTGLICRQKFVQPTQLSIGPFWFDRGCLTSFLPKLTPNYIPFEPINLPGFKNLEGLCQKKRNNLWSLWIKFYLGHAPYLRLNVQ